MNISIERLFKSSLSLLLGLIFSFSIHSLAVGQKNIQSPSALVQTAKSYYDRGEFLAAVKLLEKAAQVYQVKNNSLESSQVMALMSLAAQKLGHWQKAEQLIDSSLSLLDRIPDNSQSWQIRAQIFNAKGNLQFNRGNLENALTSWQIAENLYDRLKDLQGVTGSRINQAQALESLGFYRRSCNTILQTFQLEKYRCENLQTENIEVILTVLKDRPLSLQVFAWRSLGNTLLLMGKLQEARTILEQSQKTFKLLSSQDRSTIDESKILLSLGNTYKALSRKAKNLNQPTIAQQYNQQALRAYQRSAAIASLPGNLTSLTKIQAQLNQFSLLVTNQQWLDAQQLLPQIQVDRLPPSRATVYAKVNLAQSLKIAAQIQNQDDRNWKKIIEILNSAVRDAVIIADSRSQSYALGSLGQIMFEQNQVSIAEARHCLTQALELAKIVNAPEIAYRWEWQLGRIYKSLGQFSQAIDAYRSAFNSLQVLRSDLLALNQEVQFSFKEQVEPVYRELAELLLADESKLSQQDLENFSVVSTNTSSPNKTGDREVSEHRLVNAREVIEALQIAEIDDFFQDACAPFKKEAIENFDPTAAIFYTMILPQKLEVIVSLPDGKLLHHSTDISQRQLENTLALLQQYLKEPDRLKDVQELSNQVYGWLIQPVRENLASYHRTEADRIHTLVFVLDGFLQNIPMSALYDGKQYLIEKYATVTTPGLKLLTPKKSDRKLQGLIAGISEKLQIGSQKFAALKNVENELQNIQSLIPSEILFNNNLTKVNLEEYISTNSLSVVHIATHGQFSSDPDKTFILLWNQMLNVRDFNNLLIDSDYLNPIDLLVLSACETAVGDRRAALGLAGVAVRAGASSTLATLWQVNDESTAAIMVNFYTELKNNPQISKAEALQKAQLKLWQNLDRDWQIPSFWASYVLVGNWL